MIKGAASDVQFADYSGQAGDPDLGAVNVEDNLDM